MDVKCDTGINGKQRRIKKIRFLTDDWCKSQKKKGEKKLD